MEKKQSIQKNESKNNLTNEDLVPSDMAQPDQSKSKESNQKAKIAPVSSVESNSDKTKKSNQSSVAKPEVSKTDKKPVKPPKIEDKPFKEFVCSHLIPGLKSSIQEKGSLVHEIKLVQGERPVVGGKCWMIFCEMSDQRRFWLCFNKEFITSDKTILLAESNSQPSIVESFLIDEKKTTLALLISRVLQRLNGQKWIGAN